MNIRIEVVNIRTSPHAHLLQNNPLGVRYIYCGRPGRNFKGPFGNPFFRKGRKANIAAHREWFLHCKEATRVQLELLEAIHQAIDEQCTIVRLACFCHPLPCHCDTLKQWIEDEGLNQYRITECDRWLPLEAEACHCGCER